MIPQGICTKESHKLLNVASVFGTQFHIELLPSALPPMLSYFFLVPVFFFFFFLTVRAGSSLNISFPVYRAYSYLRTQYRALWFWSMTCTVTADFWKDDLEKYLQLDALMQTQTEKKILAIDQLQKNWERNFLRNTCLVLPWWEVEMFPHGEQEKQESAKSSNCLNTYRLP